MFSEINTAGGRGFINTCHSLGKIKIQKNPAIKDRIVENKKMVGHFRLIQNFL